MTDFSSLLPFFLNKSLSSPDMLNSPGTQPYNGLPGSMMNVGSPTPKAPSTDILGMGASNFSVIASLLANAFSPEVFNKRGAKVPTWQEKLAGGVGSVAQGDIMARALAAPKSAGQGISPLLLYMLSKGGAL